MGKSRNNLSQWSEELFLSNNKTETTAKIGAKEPSIISLFMLIFVTLSLYSFGFYQLSQAVNSFVDIVVEKVD
ncbi:MAG: hypothetical protein QNJ60_20365 [Xenococcaceae cyanobacterium MO_188.B19]|nr:hypothetical protein [Xenococcaceae cyanobacterium MO_188.B19]